MEERTFVDRVTAPTEKSERAWSFVFQGDGLLVQRNSSRMTIPYLAELPDLQVLRQHYVGTLNGNDCYAVEVAEGREPPLGMTFEGLRQIHSLMDDDLFSIAGRAFEIIDWDRTHQFCGRCGTKTRMHQTERAKECPQCGLLHFPQLSPAIIVLVERGSEILLARSRSFPTAMYSVLAGFVEPGEGLEEAVVREIREETGITVKEIHYFGSQPWPFPHSLMIAFTATYADGRIRIDDQEIIDANWYRADNLPANLPVNYSIARELIDWFIEKQNATNNRTRDQLTSQRQ